MMISPVEPDHETNVWKSCCFKVERQSVKYFSQLTILGIVMIYSMVMIVVIPNCESQRNYAALLTMCLGIILPTPTH